MSHSFSIVDYKVRQAEFFLQKIQEAELNFFAAQCFTDAFVSATRSVTFALQAVCKDISGFAVWYATQQESLRSDTLAQFFKKYRDVSIHIGDTVIRGGSMYQDEAGQLNVAYYFLKIPEIPAPPVEDVYSVCRKYFTCILQLILDTYRVFSCYVDDRWYYTEENFNRLGKSIEDAEEELGFPRGWTDIGDLTLSAERWRCIRATQTVGCEIDDLFQEYLGEHFVGPDEDV